VRFNDVSIEFDDLWGAENPVISSELHILVYEATEPVSP
jgi:hypothetical protein